jgi:hypothetical protein
VVPLAAMSKAVYPIAGLPAWLPALSQLPSELLMTFDGSPLVSAAAAVQLFTELASAR